MKIMLNMMKKKKSGVSPDILPLFEDIIIQHSGTDCDNYFMQAMGEYLPQNQRYTLWEMHGGCQGTGQDKIRKAFALQHVGKPLRTRFERYITAFIGDFTGKTCDITLNEDDNTITVTFACEDCYKHTVSGKYTAPLSLYYESCAGGRMYGLEKALGIKLKIKSMKIPESDISKENPCVYIYDIVSDAKL
ncbi:hypothetical protein [Scatolibacter rhodanostii]|uniref:hypothetical protein n=1 Tax=Scatolibacter rhodanostii TaxID=2014781 RepID=UPI000C083F10|nr:hypothetical protein [Scatolibacter rhodanostii]